MVLPIHDIPGIVEQSSAVTKYKKLDAVVISEFKRLKPEINGFSSTKAYWNEYIKMIQGLIGSEDTTGRLGQILMGLEPEKLGKNMSRANDVANGIEYFASQDMIITFVQTEGKTSVRYSTVKKGKEGIKETKKIPHDKLIEGCIADNIRYLRENKSNLVSYKKDQTGKKTPIWKYSSDILERVSVVAPSILYDYMKGKGDAMQFDKTYKPKIAAEPNQRLYSWTENIKTSTVENITEVFRFLSELGLLNNIGNSSYQTNFGQTTGRVQPGSITMTIDKGQFLIPYLQKISEIGR